MEQVTRVINESTSRREPDDDEAKDMDRFWALEYEFNVGTRLLGYCMAFANGVLTVHMDCALAYIPDTVSYLPGYRYSLEQLDFGEAKAEAELDSEEGENDNSMEL